MGEKGEGSGGKGGGKWGERGRELGMGYPPVHPLRNEDLIACSVFLSVIFFVLYLLCSHVSSNHLKRKAKYTGRDVEMFYT